MTRRMLYEMRKVRDGIVPASASFLPSHPPPMVESTRHYWTLSGWHRVQVGDRLWVRENWRVPAQYDGLKPRELNPQQMTVLFEAGGSIANHADGWRPDVWPEPGAIPDWAGKLRVGRFMPRWASRLTLVVTATKIERLQMIRTADAKAEGARLSSNIPGQFPESWYEADPRRYVLAFRETWGRLHGQRAWDENPWVVALTCTLHRCNIDKMEGV
jgi:hypothetical protein